MADQLGAAGTPQTVADAKIPAPNISGPEATVRDMNAPFENGKVHAVLIVDSDVLLAVVGRSDLDQSTGDGASASAPTMCTASLDDVQPLQQGPLHRRRFGTPPHHETHCKAM